MAGEEKDKQRAEDFDALSHPIRIKILKTLSEGSLGFAELKRSLNIESSGHLKFHLEKLNDLIKTDVLGDDRGKYCISDKGKVALLSMQPIEKYNEDARFREQTGLLIRALRTDLKSVQDIAIAQLSLFGTKVVPYLKSALSQALAELGNQETSNQRRYYGREDSSEASERAVTSLVTTLGIIGVPSTVPDIALTLPRTEAFEALAKIGNKQALDAVVSLIPTWFANNNRDEGWSSDEVDNFFRKIFYSFDEEGRIALETALTTETFVGKNVLARVLAVVGDDKSIPALVMALEKGDFVTKTEASGALKRLKAKEALPKIINELFQTELFLISARETREYGNKYYDAQKTCKALVEMILAFGSIDDWISVAFHRPRIENAEPFDQAIINSKEQAVPALTKLFEAPDASVQRAAAEMVAMIKRGDNDNQPSYYRY